MYLHRNLEVKFKEYLKVFPVVAITGPRQSGKSTMLKELLPDYKYISFDDLQARQFYYDDPKGFLNQYNDKIIFDEAQKVPELFESIKIRVDEDRQNYGRYVLTGSSQFTLIKKITESLAGRIGLLSLLPFQYNESPEKSSDGTIWQGSYPELVTRDFLAREAWYSAYLTTYIEKDVRDLLQIGDLRDFQRLIELLAANCSQILNFSSYAKDLGLTVPTIKRWISVLEASYIIFLLPPFYSNFGKRVIKSPRVYFYDTGLVSYITGITNVKLFEKGPMAGSIFENFVIADIHKKILHNTENAKIYYYRTSHGQEVDLIIDRKIYRELIEIKLSATATPRMGKVLSEYAAESDKKIVIYRGDDFNISDVEYLNYKTVCK